MSDRATRASPESHAGGDAREPVTTRPRRTGLPGYRERHGTLRWWLGATYMRVTLVAVVIVEIVGLVVLTQAVLYAINQSHADVAERLAPVATDLLRAGSDGGALQAYLDRPVSLRRDGPPLAVTMPRPPKGYVVVTDADGEVWFDNRVARGDSADGSEAAGGFPGLPGRVLRADRALVTRAQSDGEVRTARGLLRISYARPLLTDEGRTVGTLLLGSTLQTATPGLLRFGLGVLSVATILVVLIGTVFGMYASRPLVRRIEALSGAADAWGRGDFSKAVHDPTNDELGRLSGRLDRMAEELRELVRVRQSLAGARERARIARELHDSVKQQVFAASMRLGTARAASSGEVAATHVAAAEQLVRQAQQELSDLIYQLRPPAIDSRPLGQALHELTATYAEPGGPRLTLDIDPEATAPPEASAALYRIAQEALANATRHARASNIALRLRCGPETCTLRVEDDGTGFDASAVRTRGVGLTSMPERAEALGGTVRIDARPDGTGTRIDVWIPVEPRVLEGEADER